VSPVLHRVVSVDDAPHLDPLARLLTLIGGDNFDPRLREEPITFDIHDPIYGYRCGIHGCVQLSTQATWWCTRHAQERLEALRTGVGEAHSKATAVPYVKRSAVATDCRMPGCRFCADRDAVAGGLCRRHQVLYYQARRRAGPHFVEAAWVARQVALPGTGNCQVRNCQRRAESEPRLCLHHYKRWREAGSPQDLNMERWLFRAGGDPNAGVVFLARLPPLLAAEIRYAVWAHAMSIAPARWHPMWLRTLVKSCTEAGVTSLLELDTEDSDWTPQPARVNRIVREMRMDVEAVHRTRADTRELGYLDPNYWGYRFAGRRAAFDLTPISQRWLRDLTWDYLANVLDGPRRPRTSGPFEQLRRSLICLSAYLAECDLHRGTRPTALTEATAREFVADFSPRVANRQQVRGIINGDGSPSLATPTTYALAMNAVRRVMRWAMDTGAAAPAQLSREFIVSIPYGGALSHKNPRPFSDPVLRELSDPMNIRLLDERAPHDGGFADIWSIQVCCGRRISEVVNLRFDCVSEHLGRTRMWVDMTKVGKLDYAVQIPRSVYDIVLARQATTLEKFRLKHGHEPTAKEKRTIALFPSQVTNPTFIRSVSTGTFTTAFKDWIESDQMRLPGHTTHQARHTLATRLVKAGASMAHVKTVLGHISERMSDSYVLIAGSQVEPFLQRLWVAGPGAAKPGQVVPTALVPRGKDLVEGGPELQGTVADRQQRRLGQAALLE
jgi:integrase